MASMLSILDPAEFSLLLLRVILASVYPLGARAPVEGAFPSHGPDQTRYSGRAAAQPEKHQPRNPPEHPNRHHWAFRLRQVLSSLRYHLRRGPAPLRRIAFRL